MKRLLIQLHYVLLGAIASFIFGIIPSLILGFIFSNGVYAGVVLIGFVLAGAILGIKRREMIETFFDGLLEIITI